MELYLLIGLVHFVLLVTYIAMPKLEVENRIFSVTINKDGKRSGEIKSIYMKYVLLVFLGNILILAIISFLEAYELVETHSLFLLDIFALIAMILIVYNIARAKTMEYKKRNIDLSELSENLIYADLDIKSGRASIILFSIPVIILLINLLMRILQNGYFRVAMIGDIAPSILILAIMLLIYYSVVKSKQIIDPNEFKESKKRNQVYTFRWTLYTIINSIAFLLAMLFNDYIIIKNIDIGFGIEWIFIGLSLFVFVYTLGNFLITGQAGSRIDLDKKNEKSEVKMTDDDSNWKCGLIYFNPKDSAIFVQKRFGIGHTINFGNVKAVLLFVVLIIVIILYSKYTK